MNEKKVNGLIEIAIDSILHNVIDFNINQIKDNINISYIVILVRKRELLAEVFEIFKFLRIFLKLSNLGKFRFIELKFCA